MLNALVLAAMGTHILAVSLLWAESPSRRTPAWLAAALSGAAVFAVTLQQAGSRTTAVAATVGTVVLFATVSVRLHRFHPSGRLLLVSYAVLVPALLAWATRFVATAEVSTVTRALLLAPLPLGVMLAPPVLVRTLENWEPLIRRQWERPRLPAPRTVGPGSPWVCVHVPTHAEPPAVVTATLDSLARLDYPNFDVLVVDNNTDDPDLWRPVEEHCLRLGARFRFLHVEGLAGAKAGALNLALDHTDSSADLIAVVDADYQVEPEFLAETVAFFENPRMGFVQTPHAYRDADAAYLRMCDNEYANFFVTGMVSRNERNAGITVGTMCLIRREALERAGRWATWCLTEDSELAVRVHAAGYESVYLSKVYGRGLIPDTFAGYRKQRFRWSYGPVSEFFAHWRLHVPGPWHRPSALTTLQRLHHATHGLYGIATAVGLLMLPYGLVVSAVMLRQQERVAVPPVLWLAATTLLATGTALRWLSYRRLLDSSLLDWLRASVASAALAHVVMVANLTAVLRRPVPWQRTSKFRASGTGLGAVAAARTETLLGLGCLLAAGVVATRPAAGGLVLMVAVGLVLQSLKYLAAPLLALLADRQLRQATDTGAHPRARQLALAGAVLDLDPVSVDRSRRGGL